MNKKTCTECNRELALTLFRRRQNGGRITKTLENTKDICIKCDDLKKARESKQKKRRNERLSLRAW